MVRFTTGFGAWVVAIEHVLEVRPSTVVRPLPAPERGVAGVLDHKGAAVPVLTSLGVGRRHVLVLESGSTVAGLLVDEVTGVVSIEPDSIGPAPAGQRSPLVEGTVREAGSDADLVYVLDVGRALATERDMEKVS
jgi:chemotaxis signal transduction protein